MPAINQQFTSDPVLTAIAVGYSNPKEVLIADKVSPRSTVTGEEFTYTKYETEANFTVPDLQVGPRSQVKRLEIEGTEITDRCLDYGLDIPLDNRTIAKAEKKGHKPRDRAVERGTNLLLLAREVRVAKMCSNPANYGSGLAAVLSGTSMFSDPASDPVELLLEYLDKPLIRPNQLVFGSEVWTRTRTNPNVVKCLFPNSNGKGVVTKEALAELLEVDEILVGKGRINSKKPGEAPVIEPAWGNMISGQYHDPTADFMSGGMTFSLTAEHEGFTSGTIPDASMGVKGGELVRTAEMIKELVIASQTAFLLTNVIDQG